MTKNFVQAATLTAFAALMLNAPQSRAEALSEEETAELRAEHAALAGKRNSETGRPCTGAAGADR